MDVAKPGEKILLTSFGSGAGSDSFSITVEDRIEKTRNKAPLVEDYIACRTYIDYGTYVKLRGKIKV